MSKVYKCINNVQADLAKTGIGKDEKNSAQNYKFRGIDSIYNALSPLLAKHGLCILPRVLKREVTEHKTAKGGTMFYVVVEVEFAFVCAEDGSTHSLTTYGEAMDAGDKATNKAMSAAYKYAALQAFCIPTEGDNDSENDTHEVVTPPKNNYVVKPPLKPVLIDERQLMALQARINDAGKTSQEICMLLKIPSLSALEASRYISVMSRLDVIVQGKKNLELPINDMYKDPISDDPFGV